MKSLRLFVLFSFILLGVFTGGCKKESFPSRDTSGLKPPPPPPPPVIDPSIVVFDHADVADGWQTVGSPALIITGQKEGTGYIQGTITPGNDFLQFIRTLDTPIDTKLTVDNGQFSFWLYIDDVSKLKNDDGQIQVSSSGGPDNKRYGWAMADIIPTLKNGWNQLNLNLSDANVAGDGGADLSAINFFKIFFWTTDKVTVNFNAGVDGLLFKARPAVPPGTETTVSIDNCDLVDGWETVGTPVIVTSGQKEGAGYLEGKITTGNDFLQFIKTIATPIDTKVTMSTGQLQCWFYVPDVSLLKADGQIQFSSAADPDKNRVGWGLADIIPTLRNGWNQLKLNFRDGYVSGDGGPDLTAMNYLKVFFWTTNKATADLSFGLDDIKVAKVPPPPPILFDNCDVVDGWQTVGSPVLVTTGQKEGSGYIQGTIPTGNNFMQFIQTLATPIDTKLTQDNGQFTFWLNIADVSKLKNDDGQIQISSSGTPDSKRYGWAMADIIPTLKNGWNKLTLNFSDANVAGDGGADLSAINFFKIFFWTTDNVAADTQAGIDDLEFQQK